MRTENTEGRLNYISLVFCRKDFLPVAAKAAGKYVSKNTMIYDKDDLCYETIRQMSSLNDVLENMAIVQAANDFSILQDLGSTYYLPVVNTNGEFRMLSESLAVPNQAIETAKDYLNGKFHDGDVSPNPVDEPYKFFVTGGKLFVGVEPGFATLMTNKDFQREFITNSLEMCRVSMQNPALVESQLYRRFISSNL